MKVLILIIVSFIISFIGEVNGRTVDELEKILAGQFVEAFDRMIKIEKEMKELKSKDLNNTKELQFLKQQVEDLKNDNAHETEVRIENEKQIKLLKEQVEELRKITSPEKCLQLVKQGVTRGKDILLDPDGVNHGK